jgi:predicted RNA polymerase sigma factor
MGPKQSRPRIVSHRGSSTSRGAAQSAYDISGLYRYLPIQRASLLGTLGMAQVLGDDALAGVETLRTAIALGGSDRDLSFREFYRGEGLRALGRVHDAREAYERACRNGATPDIAARARAWANAVDLPFR